MLNRLSILRVLSRNFAKKGSKGKRTDPQPVMSQKVAPEEPILTGIKSVPNHLVRDAC